MVVNSFVLKGAAGLAACASVAVPGVIFREPIGKYIKNKLFPEDPVALIEKVGLTCGTPSEQGTECSKKDGKDNISFRRGESTTVTISSITSGSKIKLYKVSGDSYNQGFKFVIEDNDISEGSNKLEQFETYEIKNEGENYFLSRKTETKNEIEGALGLPSGCSLPTESSNTSTCDDLTQEKIKTIAFNDRSDGNITLTGGTAKLTITKLTTSDSVFPFGYKFGFQGKSADATLTLPSTPSSKTITFKNGVDTEYRIKKNSGNLITLEEAWNLTNLSGKVELSCGEGEPTATNGVNCTKKADASAIKVKQESSSFDLSNISNGTIKVYKDDDYNRGFKFVIEDNDIGQSSNKLEQFETYEIKEESNQWSLTRKKKSSEEKRRILGLPDTGCDFPTDNSTTTCTLDEAKLKAIKFEDKGSGNLTLESGNSSDLSLKIKIATSTEASTFPHGYKFILETNKNITFSEGNKTIKKGTNTEFKIKKNGNSLTLEKAWTVTSLGQKVGLNCTENGNNKECSLTDNKVNVNNGGNGNNKFQNLSKKGNGDKKVKYEEDAENHNQGFKFYTEENEDICLQSGSGGSGDDSNKKIEKKTGGTGGGEVTYEIKEQTNGGSTTWYLTKKTSGAS